ncbi:MAG: hypothetical protein ACI4IQ_07555 [Eubacterium sp.]
MRRKTTIIFLCAIIFAALFSSPVCVNAMEDIPSLESISFKNAVIEGGFSSEVNEYQLILEDNEQSPTLESYAVRGNADIFVNYAYDNVNHQTGVTVTLQYETGSTIYNFNYKNPASYSITSNNKLSQIYCAYGEILPKLNDSDTAYKLYIPKDLQQLKITPIPQDVNAYCAPVEIILNNDQTPEITLSCVASNGDIRSYCIKIKRVDKTVEQVKEEMAQPDYTSFVEGTLPYQRPEFVLTICAVAAGIIILVLLWRITRRILVNPYDKEEKPFYSPVD